MGEEILWGSDWKPGLMPSAGLYRGLWDGCLAAAGPFCRPCNGAGLLAPGVDFMAGVLPLEAWLGKNGGRRRGGSCCGSVGVVTAGGDFLGVRGVVVGVFVAPDPSGKGTYKDLSLEMIRKTWRIGILTPSAAISGCMVDLATGILRDGQLSGLRVIRQTDVTRTSPDRSVPGAKYIYSAVKWTRGAFKRPGIACGVRYARRC